jgi:hypothetical protein
MTCRHVLDVIDAGPFVAHPRHQVQAVQRHVGQCTDCAAARRFSERLTEQIKEMPSPALSRDLTESVMSRIAAADGRLKPAATRQPVRQQERHSKWVQAAGVAMAAAAVVLVTTSASLSGEWLNPSVAGFRISLFGMPHVGMELSSAALGAMLYAIGLFALPGLWSSRIR